MTLDIAPGTSVVMDGQPYIVDEHASFHEVDYRMDLVRLVGPTSAHERWLLAVQNEPHLMLMERLGQDWLAPLLTTFVHEGETYINLYRGSAQRVQRFRNGGRAKGRVDYALFRADSGRVILTAGRNDDLQAWIGRTLPPDVVKLPEGVLQP